jgi:hypothetical protein
MFAFWTLTDDNQTLDGIISLMIEYLPEFLFLFLDSSLFVEVSENTLVIFIGIASFYVYYGIVH